MRPQIRVVAIALSLLGCVSFAAAQTPSDPPEKFNLSPSKGKDGIPRAGPRARAVGASDGVRAIGSMYRQ
jgi:hypothetical protein